jgi:DNA modification methylase
MKPYYDNGVVQLYQADAREIPLADQSVHCCVTSPPYFGLRVYADNDHRGIGLEASIEAYVANLVDVFREVKRVLRDDGVCWLNLGDSYAASTSTTGGYSDKSTLAGYTSEQTKGRQMSNAQESRHINTGIDAGNRLGIPERVVMALQADGWTWRDTVIWAKKSCMPESLGRVAVGEVSGEGC